MRLKMLMIVLGTGMGIPLVSGADATTPWKVDRSKSSQDWTDTSSWQNGSVPDSDGSANVTFGATDEEEQRIKLPGLVDVKSLSFSNGSAYSFESVSTSASISIRDYIELLTGDLESEVYFNSDISLNVASDLEFKLGADTEIEFDGTLNSSSTRLIKVTGTGALLLSGDNSGSLNGRIKVVTGTLGLGDNNAAGNATIELGEASSAAAASAVPSSDLAISVSAIAVTNTNKPKLEAVDEDRSIGNAIEIHGYLGTEGDDEDTHELNLTGSVTLSTDTRIENDGGLLEFRGSVNESTTGVKVTIDANNPVLFSGTTGFTGGLFIEEGPVLFTDLNALPGTPSTGAFSSNYSDTYLGLLIDSASDRAAAVTKFLGQLDTTNFLGTIGFDTDPSTTITNSYSSAIDLSNTAVRQIGSVTRAELTGTITPKANTNYTFGNGGGTLLIGSLLTNDNVNEFTRGIHVQSDENDPLTVFINNGSNSFGGRASAQQSALIFGNAPGTLPTDASLRLFEGGYIGIQDTTRSVTAYLDQFDADIATGVLGFDSQDRNTNRTISDAIDLSRFTATSPEFYLGSATFVTLSGAITLPPNTTEYRFTGYKGGKLDITSVLSDASAATTRSVRIGDQSVDATTGHRIAGSENDVFSGVRLDATNTYSGGTFLEAGKLLVTQNASIGTGKLTIPGDEQSIVDALEDDSDNGDGILEKAGIFHADAIGLDISNPIDVKGFLVVEVPNEDGDHNLTLSGAIAGAGGVIKQETGTLNLTGDNSSLTGGFFVDEGSINVNHNNALGTGPLGVGTESGTTINFTTSAPSIGGLYQADDDEESSSTGPAINLASGSTLTLNLADDFEYGGTINGSGSLELTGSGTQELTGHNTYSGTTTVKSGAVLSATSGNALGSSASLTLDGGSLLIRNDPDNASSQFEATVTFGTNGGEIQGNGTLKFSSTLNIGDKVSIAAGESIGQLTFEGPVQFGELGKLKVEIGNGSGSNEIIADSVLLSSLSITSTSANPFSINLTGEDGNLPSNFSDATSRAWTIVKSNSTISTFDASKFSLDIASNLQTASGLGQWSLSLGTSGAAASNNAIFLSFTPVPEPSTFLLFGLGALLIGFRAGRRRRSA